MSWKASVVELRRSLLPPIDLRMELPNDVNFLEMTLRVNEENNVNMSKGQDHGFTSHLQIVSSNINPPKVAVHK